jgi:hypothetical protein
MLWVATNPDGLHLGLFGLPCLRHRQISVISSSPALEAIYYPTLASVDVSAHSALAKWKDAFAQKPEVAEVLASVSGKPSATGAGRKLREGIFASLDHHDRIM